MPEGLPPGYVLPKPQLPKTVGVLNVVFAILLFLGGTLYGAYVMAVPLLAAVMNTGIRETAKEAAEQRRAKLEELRRREAAAEEEPERSKLKAEREALELEADAPMPGFDMGVMLGSLHDPRVYAYSLTDVITGLLLNALMFTAGLGLLRLREWGRRLGIWIAGLKIARLLALALVGVLVISPIKVRQQQAMWARIEASQPQGAGMTGVSTAMAQIAGITD
ncbi:MAG: hypothetical protein IRY99_21305, partial [Isosphaeraceae bacterium]|nr:hypothetical protein [Isosphaeraceae bacterium]